MNRLWLILLLGLAASPAASSPAGPGRLFFTPAQRAELERVRAAPAPRAQAAQSDQDAPLRFDGVVVRSDGKSTRWVNGRAQLGATGPGGLKPGQIHANGKTYEPYQVRSLPAAGSPP
ncbi:MAG TPA: hypothetical protein PKV42_09760 [Thiobacillus sp.]|nr:MAG: hypothetical protein B7Y26_03885 [Hydrogenophilales bacterium 16-64-46]OZA38974.1 MAG: hypothetical protein B7X87_06005 [Hydrogenophilales bacterium 17-64-34]HQS82734.1 hypothetical protein [Thiobacillus sp.]HQT01279.1 hypothetical protein [Thiobacillus sp.]